MACEVTALMENLGRAARQASRQLRTASSDAKNLALRTAAEEMELARAAILAANRRDLDSAVDDAMTSAMLDRLSLNDHRFDGMILGLQEMARQPDPVGQVLAAWDRPSGISIRRIRTPLGVVGVIYESRPNVTADAGGLCLKAGNAVILRCGSESLHTSTAIAHCLQQGLVVAGLPGESIQLVPTRDRAAVNEMLTMNRYIDVIVPRGGKGLVGLIQEKARVPVFAHLEGIVHIFVDREASTEKARKVILNAKTRRPGICGAAECLLIDRSYYAIEGAPFLDDLLAAGVQIRGDGELAERQGVVAASADDFGKEFLDNVMAARIVDDVDQAIAHIQQFGSDHTDCILTENNQTAEYFFSQLDSAILMQNVSTQFADGAEFGMGAEIGIATGKLHARGPVGVEQLTSFKYLVQGNGTIRQ